MWLVGHTPCGRKIIPFVPPHQMLCPIGNLGALLMSIIKQLATFTALLLLSGCATSPDKMTSAYVSPMQYAGFECPQIAMELQRVTRRATELHGQLDKTADDDAAQMAVGMVLFWPALFFLEGGDGPQAAEYSRLKGERDALEQAALQKGCDPRIVPPMTPSVAPTASEPSRGVNRQRAQPAAQQPYPGYPAYQPPPPGYYYPPPQPYPAPPAYYPPPQGYPEQPVYPAQSYQPEQPDYRPPSRRTNKPD